MRRLSIPFFMALGAQIMVPLIFPKLHLFTFAPFVAILAMQVPFYLAASWTLVAGWTLDLLSSNHVFGFEAFLLLLTLTLIFPTRHFFFYDKPHAVSLYTAIISMIYTLNKMIFTAIFSTLPLFSWKGIISEIILMPIVDGVYGFFWFTSPYLLVKLGKKYFIQWKFR